MFRAWTDGWRGEKGGWWRLVITIVAFVAGMAAGGLAVGLPVRSRIEEFKALPEWQKDVIEVAPIAAGFLVGLLFFFLAKSLLSRGTPSAFVAPGVKARASPLFRPRRLQRSRARCFWRSSFRRRAKRSSFEVTCFRGYRRGGVRSLRSRSAASFSSACISSQASGAR